MKHRIAASLRRIRKSRPGPDLVDVDCVLCGSKAFVEIYRDEPSRVVRCKHCGLVFFNPQPSLEYLKEFYSSQSGYLSSIEENLRSYQADPQAWNDAANWILYKIRRHLPAENGQRLLDVGCAYGFFLMFARGTGLDVHGIEISTETSRYARQCGVDVQNVLLRDAAFEQDSFSIVTMNNVLEHTLNPAKDLEKAFAVLRPGGILYTAVPNFDSVVSRVDGYHWKMKSWPNHLFYFTPETLSRMLSKAGFEIKEFFTHMGESDYEHDVRVVRERLCLADDRDVRRVIECLWELGKGQELVVISQKG